MNPSVGLMARISCIWGCTFFQFVSVTGGDSNTNVVMVKSSSNFIISMVQMLSHGGLTNSLNVSGSGVSVFFHSI